MTDQQDPRLIQLIRALITFGGNDQQPREWNASALPNSPLNFQYGGKWIPASDNVTSEAPSEEDYKNQLLRNQFQKMGRK